MGNTYKNGIKYTALSNRVEDEKIIKENQLKLEKIEELDDDKGIIELGWDLDEPKPSKFDFIIPIVLWGLVALGLLTFINGIEVSEESSIIAQTVNDTLFEGEVSK